MGECYVAKRGGGGLVPPEGAYLLFAKGTSTSYMSAGQEAGSFILLAHPSNMEGYVVISGGEASSGNTGYMRQSNIFPLKNLYTPNEVSCDGTILKIWAVFEPDQGRTLLKAKNIGTVNIGAKYFNWFIWECD